MSLSLLCLFLFFVVIFRPVSKPLAVMVRPGGVRHNTRRILSAGRPAAGS